MTYPELNWLQRHRIAAALYKSDWKLAVSLAPEEQRPALQELCDERSLVAARGHCEPAGQIEARKIEIVRINGALLRAEELSDTWPLLSNGLSEKVDECRLVSARGPTRLTKVTMVRARLLNHPRHPVDGC